jgi:hypothetical protein
MGIKCAVACDNQSFTAAAPAGLEQKHSGLSWLIG